MNIKICGLTKKFKNKVAIDELSLIFNKGIYGLLGPNGAGKTTLMRCMLGLYEPNMGSISYDGVNIKYKNDFASSVGYLPQKFGLFKELSVYEMMEYMAVIKKVEKYRQKKAIENSIEIVNLSDQLKNRVGSLSGGMIRRLGIAQALVSDPEVVVFDEPTVGLDPEERMRFKNIVTIIGNHKTVIISTHIVEDVEACCDQVVIMNNGKNIVQGTQEEIKNIALEKVYEVIQSEERDIKGTFYCEKTYQKQGKSISRILCMEKQKFIPVEPSIEDGYMFSIKGY